MYAHDQTSLYYVVSGDRIFCIPLDALQDGYRRAHLLGMDDGALPAGESPFAADTQVIELAEMLTLDDGEPRSLVPVDLASNDAMILAAAGPAELTRAALMVWSDYCDESSGLLDEGLATDDAIRLAGTGDECDMACD